MKTDPSLPAFYVKHEYAVVLFFVIIWQAVLLCASNGRFLETDNYTHALRLMDFIQSGSWNEILYRHDNCPFGQNLHFTRIMDMFLYVMTLPFLPFMELKRAILFGGFLYNPVMACLSAVALIWAGRAFLSPLLRVTGTFFYFANGSVLSLFLAGRPDHHVLLNLLLIIVIGCLTYGVKTQKPAYYKTAGLFTGLSVWATPEGFLAGQFLLAGLTTAWLCRCQDIRPIRLFSQFLFISTTVCWLINPPIQGMFYADNGRLSVLMVVISGLAFATFDMEERLEKKLYIRSFPTRIGSLFFLTLTSLGITLTLFGTDSLFSFPIPKELYDIWTAHINELKSCLENIVDSPAVIPFFVLLFGVIVYPRADEKMKKLIITNGIPLFLFLILTVMYRRFSRPASVFIVFVLWPALYVYCQDFHFSPQRFAGIKKALVFLLFCSYSAILFISFKNQKEIEGTRLIPKEDISRLLRKNEKGCVLIANNFGPQIAWETGNAVIGSPYHSNVQGIIDDHAFFNSTDIDHIQAILKKRLVSSIILLHSNGKINTRFTKDSLPAKLVLKNDSFCFLKQVTNLPEDIKEKYSVYHVDFLQCKNQ